MLKIGDWVKQYCAGYWQIIDIKPKYAEEDVDNENLKCKKGDLIGSWALMKKGFTPKMKFRVDSDCCDARWCVPVSEAELGAINEYFATHPKDAEKFEKKPFEPRPAIATLWLEIPEEKQTDMEAAIRELPESFTEKQLRDCLKEKGLCECVSKPSQSVNATLQCDHFFWELDENFDCIYRNPRLT